MRNSVRNPGERGSIVLFATLLIVLLGVIALTVDYGMILANRSAISAAVDAGALAGGGLLLVDQATARTVATQYVKLNISAKLNPNPVPVITFPTGNSVRVFLTMNVASLFARAVGLTTFRVAAAAEATRLDPELVVIIDRSGSMCEDSHGVVLDCPDETATKKWQPFRTVLTTAKSFVDQMVGNPTYTLISYSTTVTLDVASTASKTTMKTAIDKLEPSGYTDIAGSVTKAINQLLLTTNARPKLIVLLTDGRPNIVNGAYVGDDDARPRNALITSGVTAKSKGVVVYSITYGSDADEDLMRQVAESTDGRFYSAPNGTALQAVYTDIAGKVYVRLTKVD